MSTPEHPLYPLFTDIMDRMLKAGWLKSYRFTDGKGFHLVWGIEGAKIAQDLAATYRRLGLSIDSESRVVFASVLAHGYDLELCLDGEEGRVSPVDFLRFLEQVGILTAAVVGDTHGDFTDEGSSVLGRLYVAIRELEIDEEDADRLLVMFEVVLGWLPDGNTEVRFSFGRRA